jgi:hypothetical protein
MLSPQDFVKNLFLAAATVFMVLVIILFIAVVTNYMIAPLLVSASTKLAGVNWGSINDFLIFVLESSLLFLFLKVVIFRKK